MAPLRNILPLHSRDRDRDAPPSSTSPRNGHHQNGASEKSHHHRHHPHTRRNALSAYMSTKWRNEFVAAFAEFCGTFMFLFFAFGGTQVANTAAVFSDRATAGQDSGNDGITQAPNTSVLLYISLVFGFSLMVSVWVFFRVSGGLFNPAVSCLFPVHFIFQKGPKLRFGGLKRA